MRVLLSKLRKRGTMNPHPIAVTVDLDLDRQGRALAFEPGVEQPSTLAVLSLARVVEISFLGMRLEGVEIRNDGKTYDFQEWWCRPAPPGPEPRQAEPRKGTP